MTDIDEIPAGRALDALVAKKVMGCRAVFIEYNDAPIALCNCDSHEHEAEASHIAGLLAHYSIDIAAAWQVVERLRERGIFITLDQTRREPVEWVAHFINPHWVVGKIGYAETAPLAICRAAIKL